MRGHVGAGKASMPTRHHPFVPPCSGVGGPAMLSVNYECVPLPKKLATLAACE